MAPPISTKKILKEFIGIYRSHPCLWQIKNKDYRDPHQKQAAYNLLIEKYREIEPNANREIVVKKINSMRSNVRKERRKHNLSLKSGVSADDVYRIRLWYYDLFSFIYDDQSTPRESSSNLDSDDENSFERDNTEDFSNADEEFSSNLVSESVRDHFKRPLPIVTEDRCDIIGKNVAVKLRTLDAKQIIVAEKLINDLLFEAELGHLTPEHAYVNMRDILQQSQQIFVPGKFEVE